MTTAGTRFLGTPSRCYLVTILTITTFIIKCVTPCHHFLILILAQILGLKYNYSQPFFVHWDVLLKTRMTREEVIRRKAAKHAKAL